MVANLVRLNLAVLKISEKSQEQACRGVEVEGIHSYNLTNSTLDIFSKSNFCNSIEI